MVAWNSFFKRFQKGLKFFQALVDNFSEMCFLMMWNSLIFLHTTEFDNKDEQNSKWYELKQQFLDLGTGPQVKKNK